MKRSGLINRYVFREMVPVFILSLLSFTLVFLMAKILDITDLIVQYGISVKAMLLMLLYWIPSFLIFVIPMSIMIAVVLAFLRLSNDNEILAMKTAGISTLSLLPPVFVFCLIGLLATAFMTLYASPSGRHHFKLLIFETATSNIHAGIKERTFNDGFQDVMLYVNEVDERQKRLKDIFIEDRRTEGMVTTVVAPRGEFFYDPARGLSQLRLYDGIINQLGKEKETAHFVRFNTYDFRLDAENLTSGGSGREKGMKEMTLPELHINLARAVWEGDEHRAAQIQYHKRFSIPFACFVLGLIAVPLGIQSRSAKRSFGVIIALFFFLLYYALLSVGLALSETRRCHPAVGMWLPNAVLGTLAVYLLVASTREHSVRLLSRSLGIFQRLGSIGRGG